MHDSDDAYLWRALYDNEGNEVLDEHEIDGTPHTFAEVDQARLLAFVLIPNREGLASHAVHLQPEQRLIFFRRARVDNTGPCAGLVRKAHVIGWQQTIGGRNVKSMIAVFDNGACLLTSDEALIEP
jgi:hypothetical protein